MTRPTTQTASGQVWDLLHPDSSQVRFCDLAYQLAHVARFGGAARPFVSVAQHCVLVADLAPAYLRLPALLHDAHEAILGDWTTPVKQALALICDMSQFDALEYRTALAIHRAAGVEFPLGADDTAALHRADMIALATEKRDAMAASPAPWPGLPEPDPREINFLTPPEAERLWLDHLLAAGVSTNHQEA